MSHAEGQNTGLQRVQTGRVVHALYRSKESTKSCTWEEQLHEPIWVQPQVDGKQICMKGPGGPGGQAGHELAPWQILGSQVQERQAHTEASPAKRH